MEDYNLCADLYANSSYHESALLISPLKVDLNTITNIYLKYHGLVFAQLFTDYDLGLHLCFEEECPYVAPATIWHSVLIKYPVHTGDMRFSLIPELIIALDNYDIKNGPAISLKVKSIQRTLI